MKKSLTMLLICSLLMGCLLPVAGAVGEGVVFTDVDPKSSQGMAVYKMAEMGFVHGMGDGTFQPGETLTRAQFVAMINRIFALTAKDDNPFTDVTQDQWYYGDVLIGYCAGYIKGVSDTQFAPDELLTREQVCVILHRYMNFVPLPFSQQVNDPVSDWAMDAVMAVLSNQLMQVEQGGLFRATQPMTRGEVAGVLVQFIVTDPSDLTPPDIKQLTEEELQNRLQRVITSLEEELIPAATSADIAQVFASVKANMSAYLKDKTHDYQTAAKATYKLYHQLPEGDQKAMIELAQKYNEADDLLVLYDFFFGTE